MKISGIYKIKCLANNKVYIGQSVNVNHRLSTHFSMLRKKEHYNTFLQRAFNKYGESNFEYELIQKCSTREELNYYETYWYEYYCKLLGKENVFNLAHTGNAHNSSEKFRKQRSEFMKANHNSGMFQKGYKQTEEQIKRSSQRMKGENNISCRFDVKIKKSIALKGRKKSEEIKKKISIACKGRPSAFKGKHHTEEIKKASSLRALKYYEEHPEAREKLRQQHLGKRKPNKFQVWQYDKNMVLIKKWNYLKDIEKELHFDRHTIKKHSVSKTMFEGCYWLYVEKTI